MPFRVSGPDSYAAYYDWCNAGCGVIHTVHWQKWELILGGDAVQRYCNCDETTESIDCMNDWCGAPCSNTLMQISKPKNFGHHFKASQHAAWSYCRRRETILQLLIIPCNWPSSTKGKSKWTGMPLMFIIGSSICISWLFLQFHEDDMSCALMSSLDLSLEEKLQYKLQYQRLVRSDLNSELMGT